MLFRAVRVRNISAFANSITCSLNFLGEYVLLMGLSSAVCLTRTQRGQLHVMIVLTVFFPVSARLFKGFRYHICSFSDIKKRKTHSPGRGYELLKIRLLFRVFRRKLCRLTRSVVRSSSGRRSGLWAPLHSKLFELGRWITQRLLRTARFVSLYSWPHLWSVGSSDFLSN